jgi:hypothetical protein
MTDHVGKEPAGPLINSGSTVIGQADTLAQSIAPLIRG